MSYARKWYYMTRGSTTKGGSYIPVNANQTSSDAGARLINQLQSRKPRILHLPYPDAWSAHLSNHRNEIEKLF